MGQSCFPLSSETTMLYNVSHSVFSLLGISWIKKKRNIKSQEHSVSYFYVAF